MFRKAPKERLEPEWLIAGLGNPGSEYSGTRHNVGFEVLESLAKDAKIKLDQSKHKSRFGIGRLGATPVILLKPMTYMNLSGQAIAPTLRQWSLKPERLIVIADETDLPLGRIRIRAEGGAGGHNGHKSIIGSLGTQSYARVRLGIGRVDKDDTIDHVLGRFTMDEKRDAHDMIAKACEAVRAIVDSGVEAAMNVYNRASAEG